MTLCVRVRVSTCLRACAFVHVHACACECVRACVRSCGGPHARARACSSAPSRTKVSSTPTASKRNGTKMHSGEMEPPAQPIRPYAAPVARIGHSGASAHSTYCDSPAISTAESVRVVSRLKWALQRPALTQRSFSPRSHLMPMLPLRK
eukprot:766248-Pleurochrysis_carterae.AAC.4